MAALILAAGCDREARDTRGNPLPETGPALTQTSSLIPAGGADPQPDPRAAKYLGNAYSISQGQQLFQAFNCSGCHFNGGGGIGPPLMDGHWKYGGSMEQIVATIMQGRPNGMPSFRTMLTEQQMWQLAAYVRTLSGSAPKDAISSRSDDFSGMPPLTQVEPKAPQGTAEADPPQ